MTAYLNFDLAHSIEEQARKILGINSIPAGTKDKETVDPKSPSKKEKKDKELNYNRDFEVFSKVVEKIHETAGVKSCNTPIIPLQMTKQSSIVSPSEKKKILIEEEYFNNPSLFL